MAGRSLLRGIYHRSRLFSSVDGGEISLTSFSCERLCHYAATSTTDGEKAKEKRSNWFTLPPFSPVIGGASLGKAIADQHYNAKHNSSAAAATTTTALKWVLQCCPELPRSLVQKLFRLRQVRRESSDVPKEERKLKRVGPKDSMSTRDRIFLPITVKKIPSVEADELVYNEDEMKFLQSLELYKDPAIVVINKPPGMPVQGGIGVRRSIDKMAAKYLRYDYPESPRLVHRLDRDCSGVLVMGRTQLSTSMLHSIFREKTSRAPNEDLHNKTGMIRKRYWALVIGSPRCSEGLISVPLGKVVVDDGKSERITVIANVESSLAQYAATEYRVIGSSCDGYTWLELCPITGRKHQLRVHCAEVLGTPIVGDYKYGWQAHKNLKRLSCFTQACNRQEKYPKPKSDPFDLDLESGSISDKQPRLHLHCKEMLLPRVSVSPQESKLVSDHKLVKVQSIKFDAPLPSHMQKSWDLLNSSYCS